MTQMYRVNRKITYRLYPSKSQAELLGDHLGLHCRTYNTLLEEHRRLYEQKQPRYSFKNMCKDITRWRSYSGLGEINAQSLQVTAKRVDLAFKAFFRRVKAGEEPGYPRFKSTSRFQGWGYKTHGDGWKFFGGEKSNHRLRLSGVGMLKIRGRGRFEGIPKTCEILKKGDHWYASITFAVKAKDLYRERGEGTAAFDWGVDTLLTIAKEDGTLEAIDNPRFLKNSLDALTRLQRAISKEEIKAKAQLGLANSDPVPRGTRLPVSRKLKRMYQQLRSLHRKIANQRHDFYHKLANHLVSTYGTLSTEKLDVKAMVRRPDVVQDESGEFQPNGAGQKSKLNRSIHDAAPAKLVQILTNKAGEAGMWVGFAETKIVKPTQRCHKCGTLVPKALDVRMHQCPDCDCRCGRDENAAKTLLRWLFEGFFWSGTAPAEV